ncbi:sensor histidine kinase [Nonomuraea fuscirosea]|uniref:sensor histidine kinase n=1 Tax=Nonomuraea fuscirosea TaxID=1291556 RepID=UPI0034145C20
MRPGWQPFAVEAAAAVATMLALVMVPVVTGGNLTWGGTVAPAVCLVGLQIAGRRRPLTALAAGAVVVIGLSAAGLVGGWVWPASVAYARAGLRGRGAGAALIGVLSLIAGSALEGEVLALEALWLCLIFAATAACRAHRRYGAERAARLRSAEQVAVARDVHDIVAHTLAVVGIQLTVAQDALDDDPEEARRAMRLAQQVRAEAAGELRALIGVLREEDAAADRLSSLVARVRAAGLRVALRQDGRADVPSVVDWTVYRVVQEALTNTVKHAGAQWAEVVISHTPGEVRLRVTDDGRAATSHRTGHGIAGMRERVTALGGTLTAGPAEGGYTVRAIIPVTASAGRAGSSFAATPR